MINAVYGLILIINVSLNIVFCNIINLSYNYEEDGTLQTFLLKKTLEIKNSLNINIEVANKLIISLEQKNSTQFYVNSETINLSFFTKEETGSKNNFLRLGIRTNKDQGGSFFMIPQFCVSNNTRCTSFVPFYPEGLGTEYIKNDYINIEEIDETLNYKFGILFTKIIKVGNEKNKKIEKDDINLIIDSLNIFSPKEENIELNANTKIINLFFINEEEENLENKYNLMINRLFSIAIKNMSIGIKIDNKFFSIENFINITDSEVMSFRLASEKLNQYKFEARFVISALKEYSSYTITYTNNNREIDKLGKCPFLKLDNYNNFKQVNLYSCKKGVKLMLNNCQADSYLLGNFSMITIFGLPVQIITGEDKKGFRYKIQGLAKIICADISIDENKNELCIITENEIHMPYNSTLKAAYIGISLNSNVEKDGDDLKMGNISVYGKFENIKKEDIDSKNFGLDIFIYPRVFYFNSIRAINVSTPRNRNKNDNNMENEVHKCCSGSYRRPSTCDDGSVDDEFNKDDEQVPTNGKECYKYGKGGGRAGGSVSIKAKKIVGEIINADGSHGSCSYDEWACNGNGSAGAIYIGVESIKNVVIKNISIKGADCQDLVDEQGYSASASVGGLLLFDCVYDALCDIDFYKKNIKQNVNKNGGECRYPIKIKAEEGTVIIEHNNLDLLCGPFKKVNENGIDCFFTGTGILYIVLIVVSILIVIIVITVVVICFNKSKKSTFKSSTEYKNVSLYEKLKSISGFTSTNTIHNVWENDISKIFRVSGVNIINPEFITVYRKVGSGSQASVFECGYNNVIVCAKIYNFSIINEIHQQDIEQSMKRAVIKEIVTMSSLRHPHIVNFIGASLSNSCLIVTLLTEFCEGGDLAAFIKSIGLLHHIGKLSHISYYYLILSISKQILSALCYIHEPPNCIRHSDLKPENILLKVEINLERLQQNYEYNPILNTEDLTNSFSDEKQYSMSEASSIPSSLNNTGNVKMENNEQKEENQNIVNIRKLVTTHKINNNEKKKINSKYEELEIVIEVIEKLQVKLVDFGICTVSRDITQTLLQSKDSGVYGGTPLYAAPCQIKNDGKISLTVKSDIYSFGTILMVMMNDGIHPLIQIAKKSGNKEVTTVLTHILKYGVPIMPMGRYKSFALWPKLAQILKQCWNVVPSLRPSARVLLEQINKLIQELETEISKKFPDLYKYRTPQESKINAENTITLLNGEKTENTYNSINILCDNIEDSTPN